MATKLEELRWKLFQKRYNILFQYGIKRGLIGAYSDELIEKLRHIYCGGIPASILLLYEKLSNGHCCDRSKLVTLGFGNDNFRTVLAEIDTLRLNPQYIDEYRQGISDEDYSVHSFAERIAKDGTVWVYDTSVGFVIEKSFYYRLEHPKIVGVKDEKETLEYLDADFLREADIERDKYALPVILSIIEATLEPTQYFYLEQLKQEIEILKQELDYDGLCQEIDEDMKAKGLK